MSAPEHVQPPQWPLCLMRGILRTEYLEEIEGDMEEIFQHNLHQYSVRTVFCKEGKTNLYLGNVQVASPGATKKF